MILDHFGGKRLEKVENGQNWVFQITTDHLRDKRLVKVQKKKKKKKKKK